MSIHSVFPRRWHFVGGASGIGRWLLDHVTDEKNTVYCYDVDKLNLGRLPNHVRQCPVAGDDYASHATNFSNGDFVVFSVPPHLFHAASRGVVPHVKPGTLFVCVNSVQGEAVRHLLEIAPPGTHVLGCHPLFGPLVSSPDGFCAAVTEYDEAVIQHREFRRELSDKGLLVVDLSAEDHDRYMSMVQALTHFCMLSFMGALVDGGANLGTLNKLRTPNFQALYAFGCRILNQKASTLAGIQHSEAARAMRKVFLEHASNLDQRLGAAENIPQAANVIEDLRRPLQGADVEEGEQLSVAMTESVQKFEMLLQRYRRSGEPFIFRHRRKGQLRAVIIKEIEADQVTVEDAVVSFVHLDGTVQWALRTDPIAVENYKWMGISFPKNKNQTVVKKKFMQLVPSDELRAFRKRMVLPIKTKFNVENREERDQEFFEQILPKVVPGILSCEYCSEFRKKNGYPTVLLEVTHEPTVRRGAIIQTISDVINKRYSEQPVVRARGRG